MKLSERIAQGNLTRTQRKLQQKEQERISYQQELERQQREAQLKQEQAKISEMTLEQYEQYYPTLAPWVQSAFTSPAKIKSKQEIQKQENLQRVQGEIETAEKQVARWQQSRWKATSDTAQHRAGREIVYYQEQLSALMKAKERLASGEADYGIVVGQELQKGVAESRKYEAKQEAKVLIKQEFAKQGLEVPVNINLRTIEKEYR
jgi:hypothetical protein